MSKWLDLSNVANKLRQSYVTGFIDISGGLSVRNNSSIGIYNSLSNATIPSFSINSDTMRIYDPLSSSYVDISNAQILYLKDLTQNVNSQLQDLTDRSRHITNNVANVDTMLNFDYSNNNIYTYSNIVPVTANTYSLGTPDKPFGSLYINQGTIHFIDPSTNVETAAVSFDPSTNDLVLNSSTGKFPINNTKYVNGVLVTPLLTVGGNVGIGVDNPTKALDISGSVGINGNTAILGSLNISSDITTTGNLNATNIKQYGQSLDQLYVSTNTPVIRGNATALGITVSNDLIVGGNAYFNNNITVTGDASMNGRLYTITPSNTENSNLVATTAYVQNQGFIFANNSSLIGTTSMVRSNIQQKLSVGGDVSLNSKLYVFDNTTLNNNLTVNGNANLNKLFVSNDLSLNGNLSVAGITNVPTPNANDNSNKIATTSFVKTQVSNAFSNPPAMTGPLNINSNLNVLNDLSVNGRLFVTGDVSLNANLYVVGNIVGKTQSNDNNSTFLATTAYVKNQGYATVASPTFTGTTTAPTLLVSQLLNVTGDSSMNGNVSVVTQSIDNSSNLVATTAYVKNQGYATVASPTFTGTITSPNMVINGRSIVNGDISMNANLKISGNAAFLGNATAVTPATNDSSTLIATTAFVQNQGYAALSGATFTGPVAVNSNITTNADMTVNANAYIVGNLTATTPPNIENSNKVATTAFVKNQNYIQSYSPVLTGIPTAPTATIGDTSKQVATTEFVRNEVTSFVNAIPSVLDSIQQLSTALAQTDASFVFSLSTSMALKADKDSPTITGIATLPITNVTDVFTAYDNVILNNNLYLNGDASMNGLVSVVTPDTIDNSTRVATTAYVQNQGYAKLSGATFTGGLIAGNNFTVNGNALFNHGAILNNDSTINGNATVTGKATFNSNVVIGNSLHVVNDSSFNANVFVQGNLTTVTPDLSNSSKLVATTEYVQLQNYAKTTGSNFTGNTSFSGSVSINGDVSLNSNLVVGGNTTLQKQLNVLSDISLNGNLYATGLLYENGQLLTTKYATLNSPAFTGTVSGITQTMIGLGNVDNTTDMNKPISTATQSALNLKPNIMDASFTGLTTMNAANVTNALSIGGDVSMNANMYVNGDVSLNGNAFAKTPATSDNSTQIATTAFVKNQGFALLSGAEFNGNVIADQNLHVVGNVVFDSSLVVANDATFQSNVNVNGKLNVNDNVILGKNLIVENDVSLNSRLFVNSDGSFNGRLFASTPLLSDNSRQVATTAFVVGQGFAKNTDPSFVGNVSVGSNLVVNGNTKLTNVVMTGDSSMNGRLFLAGDASLNGNMFVNKDTTLNGNVFMKNAVVISSDSSLNGRLNVLGDASFNSNVFITGNAFAKTPSFSDNSKQIATTEYVKGQNYAPISSPSFDGTVNMPSAVVAQNMIVNSDAYLNAGLYVTGDADIGGNLTALTPDLSDNSRRVATTAYTNAKYASLASPTFTGTTTMEYASVSNNLFVAGDVSVNGFLTAKTPTFSDNSSKVATTSFIKSQFAPLASPTFTGTTTMTNKLNIVGDVSLNGNLISYGLLYENGQLLTTKYATLNSPTFTGTVSGITKSMIGGLENVDDTSDINKPVSSATQSALNLKANVASPTFTGTTTMTNKLNIVGDVSLNGNLVSYGLLYENGQLLTTKYATLNSPTFTGVVSGIDASMVGLGNVNNTSDLNKPVSNAMQTALNLKANLTSPTFGGFVTMPTVNILNTLTIGGDVSLNGNLVSSGLLYENGQLLTTKYATLNSPTFTGTVSGITKDMISGLENVNNTSDINKPVSTAMQTALNLKANLASPTFGGLVTMPTVNVLNSLAIGGDVSLNGNLISNGLLYENGQLLTTKYATLNSPTFTGTVSGITKAMISGLENVDNTSDANKPISTATQSALNLKANLASPTFTGTTVMSTANISNKLSVVGDVSMNGRLYVSNTIFENNVPLNTVYASLASPTFTGTVSGIDASMVGLGNVNNTSDLNKPVSTAMQNALNLKASLSSPTFSGLLTANDVTTTGNLIAVTPNENNNSTLVATTAFVNNQNFAKLSGASFTGDVNTTGNLVVSQHTTLNGDISLNGIVTAVTPFAGDNSTRVATTEYVYNLGYASLDSPNFTGIPTAPTMDTSANTSNQIATTQYVSDKIAAYLQSASQETINAIQRISQELQNTDASFTTQILSELSAKADIYAPSFTGNVVFNNNTTMYGNANIVNNLSVNGVISQNGAPLTSLFATLNSPHFTGTVYGIDASMVGLGNVNNTSDLNKPVSTAMQNALNLKANITSPNFIGSVDMSNNLYVRGDLSLNGNLVSNGLLYENGQLLTTKYATLASPTFTGTVSGITKSMIGGLNNVDNTSDLNKPISNATESALNLKANSTNPLFVGDVDVSGNLLVRSDLSLNGNLVSNGLLYENGQLLTSKYATLASPTFTGTVSGITKAMISGLENVDNTSDINKPVSNATQSALNLKANISAPVFVGNVDVTNNLFVRKDISLNGNLVSNGLLYENGQLLTAKYATLASPTFTGIVSGIDASMVGLGNVDNTSDVNKPVSTATQSALNLKANLVAPRFVGDVDVSGNMYIRSDISLNGNLIANGSLYEKGNAISTIYAPIASPTFTGTVSGITKSMVGLGNVDNTSDANKPVSTATQSALDLKSNIANPSFTGNAQIEKALVVGGDLSLNGRLFANMDVSFNGNVFVSTPSVNDNSSRVATTAFVNTLNQSYVKNTGANFVGDVSINTNLYVLGDLSLSGNLNMTYKANTIPFNAIIGGLGSNAMDLTTNQIVSGIKTFVNDVSLQSQLVVAGNSTLGENNLVTTLYQTAPDPSAGTISNLSLKTNNYNGTYVNEFEISKGTGTTVCYNTTDGSLNISTDGGNTWNYMALTSGTRFGGMLCLSPDGRIQLKQEYSGTTPLLFVSTDWGATFSSVSVSKPILYSNSFFNYTTNNNQTYAFSHDSSLFYFISRDTNNSISLWKSTDSSFINYSSLGSWNYSLANCPRAVACSSNGQYVLLITGIVPANGVYLSVSTNYGSTFTRTANSLNSTWNSIAVSYSGKYMTATNNSAIYQSSDFGSTWTSYTSITGVTWNSISMSNDGKNRIACGTTGYQYASFDYGVTWTLIPNSYGNWKKTVMVDSSNNNNINVFSHDGVNVFKSFYNCSDILQKTAINTDLNITPAYHYLNVIGKTNNVVKTNVFNNYIGNTASMSSNGQIIVIPIQNNQTIISRDYGSTWNVLAGLSAQTSYNSSAVSGNGKIIYVRKGTTTYRSGNSGASWTAYTTLAVEDTLAGTAISNDGMYIVFAGKDLTTGNSNIYVSSNYGISWTTAATFPTSNNKFVACMSSNGQYMSVLSTLNYVLVSIDYGVTWTIKYINALLTSNYMCMSSTGQYQSVVSNRSIFVSSDYGNSFTCVYTGSSSSLFTNITMIGTGEYQYAVNKGDNMLYRSSDYGVTWSTMFTNATAPSNTIISSDGTVMLYSVSGDIIISRMADYSGSISQTGLSISRKGIVSALDLSVNGTIATKSLVVDKVYENGNLLASKYATLASPSFTGTVSGITKAMVGLGNVDNTSDANKPLSTATQNALNLKANISSPVFIGATTTDSLIINQTVSAVGDVSMNANLFVGGKIYANYADNTIPVTAIIGGIPTATGSFENDISGGSRLYIAKDAYLNSRLFVSDTVNVKDISASGNFLVNGTSNLLGDVSANRLFLNNMTVKRLYATLDASFNGNLDVSGSIMQSGTPISTIYAPLIDAPLIGTTTVEKLYISQELVNTRDTTLNGNLIVFQDSTFNTISANVITENGQLLSSKYVLSSSGTLTNPTVIGTITGVTKSMVGLGNVDNTSDLNKPISTAMQTALDGKMSRVDASFIGVPLAPTASAGTTTAQIATTAFVGTAINNLIGPAAGNSLSTLMSIASAINNDPNYHVSVDSSLNLRAPISNPVFTGTVHAPIIDASSTLMVGGDASMNANLFVKQNAIILGDLSVNGNTSLHFATHSIPSTAIDFINNEYSSMTINTQRTDVINYDDEFFELSVPADSNGFVETFYSNNADLSLNGNIRINGNGLSIINGDLEIGNRLILGTGFIANNNSNFVGDVSMNSNCVVGGSLIAEANMAVFGVINQQNIIIDELTGNMSYQDTMFYQSGGITSDITNIKNHFAIDISQSVVTIGSSSNDQINVIGKLSAPGLYISDVSNTFNTSLGYGSNTASNHNTSVGYSAGSSITTGSNNIMIGYNAQPSLSTVNNEITIGNSSIERLRCNVNTITSLSDVRDKKNIEILPLGLDFVSLLKPVKFDWNRRDGSLVDKPDLGFIAQDLKDAEDSFDTKVPNLVCHENPDKLEASYGALLPIMVKAIQDLKEIVMKQQDEIEYLKSKLYQG